MQELNLIHLSDEEDSIFLDNEANSTFSSGVEDLEAEPQYVSQARYTDSKAAVPNDYEGVQRYFLISFSVFDILWIR